MEPKTFLTYRYQGFKFEFEHDKIIVTNERHLPFFETYKIQISEYHTPPFIIILEETGTKHESA